jgi:hypothetical protein
VTFYIDRRRLRTLTSKHSRHGMLTVYVPISGLAIGSHTLLAKITLMPNAASTKPARVTRTLHVARCAAVSGAPRFAG